MNNVNQFTAGDRTPYTYIIRFPSGKVYYGVKYARSCNPKNLGITYFSSSNIVKRHIELHGLQNVIFEIRKIFNTVQAAKDWETKVLRRMDARNHPNFLNKHNNNLYPIDNSGTKNPMYGLPGTMLGKHHRPDSIEKIKYATSGSNNPFYGKHHTPESIEKIRSSQIGISKHAGQNNPFFGKKHSKEIRDQITRTKRIKDDLTRAGNIYHTPHGTFTILRESELPILHHRVIEKWCNHPDTIITQQMTIRSKYLSKIHIGKTFRDLGFWLEQHNQ